jgi:hypothetical protein
MTKMTMTGRIALLANLGLSLLFAFWGFGVYTHQINWTDQKMGEREGEYAKRASTINAEKEARNLAEQRWRAAHTNLVTLESKRPLLQDRYEKLLRDLRSGKPVVELVHAKGQLQVDPEGFPLVKETKLDNLEELNKKYDARQKDIVKVTEEIERLVQEEQKLSDMMKGLRARWAEDQDAEQKSLSEQRFIKTPLYNAKVEAQSLVERRRVLEGRLKELQSIPVARQP